MIDEKEILPFNFFSYGGVYSGDHASSAVNADDITKKEFEYSEEGRKAAIEWIQKMYTDRKDEWDNAPSINQAVLYDGRKNT